MSDIQKVIVGGGTLGKYIVESLIAADFSVTILSRPTSQSKFPDGVEAIRSDYTVSALKEAFHGQDAVVSAVSVQGIMDQVAVIDAVEGVGVKRFVLGEFANAPDQKRLLDLEFARKSKKEVLKYAMEKAAANSHFA